MTEAHRTTDDRLARMLEMRSAGSWYREIAAALGMPESTVNRWVRKAIASGVVPADRIPAPVARGLPDEEYRKRWIERVRARCIVDDNGCWLWQGGVDFNGYGQTTTRGSKNRATHRHMYSFWHQVTLSFRDDVCHACDVKRCCNPAHLWIGNRSANMLDHSAKGRNKRLARNHCIHGHPYTPENLHVYETSAGLSVRRCKQCARIKNRLRSGWTLEQALTLPKTPPGYRTEAARNAT